VRRGVGEREQVNRQGVEIYPEIAVAAFLVELEIVSPSIRRTRRDACKATARVADRHKKSTERPFWCVL
jgi:hypothetical protein